MDTDITSWVCYTFLGIILSIIFWWKIVEQIIKWKKQKEQERIWEYHRKEQEEEWDLKRLIDPKKAEIRNIINAKIELLSVRSCPKCRSTGVKLKRTYASYITNKHTETHVYYDDFEDVDKSGEKYHGTERVESVREVYDGSDFSYRVNLVCQKCGYVYFSDIITYKDKTDAPDKEKRFKAYKQEEVISVDSFLEDIYPPITTVKLNLETYQVLINHLRGTWAYPNKAITEILKQEPSFDEE